MEDEVQLQSLAKRLINIYNACKWSKTRLHLRKKKRTHHNDYGQFEELTEIETESSARTVFVYNRRNRRKIERTEEPDSALESADREMVLGRLHEQYCNEQAVNVCTCRKCCCDPTKEAPRYEMVDKRRKQESKKKDNSTLVICLNPTDKQEANGITKNATKGCCCSPQQSYGITPPVKKKSSIKASKPPGLNKDCVCQCGPGEAEGQFQSPMQPPPVCTSEPFCPYYPPPQPPQKPTKSNKAANCQCCPASAGKKKCCECSPSPQNVSASPQNVSCCCQCPPPAPPENSCCRCPPSQPSTSGCCQCQPSPPSSSGCCHCPPSPVNTSDCCQCEPPQAASFGCQCCPPPPNFDDFTLEDNSCCCQSEDTNQPTVIRADKIIIPTCYFNEGEPSASGNYSLAASEEVRNELLNDNASDQHRFRTSDKQINTSCVIVRSCNSSLKRETAHVIAPVPVPVVIPQRASSTPQSVRDCQNQKCHCHRKEMQSQMINTNSCAVVQSCTSSLKKPKGGVCCKCQKNVAPRHAPVHPTPTGPQVLRYPSDQNFVPSSSAGVPPYNSAYPSGEERMVAKYSPQPFSDQMYPSYGGYPSPPVPPPLYGGMVPPRQMDHTALLRSQSTPLCCNLVPKGEGDHKIAGINDDTEAEIYATLQKIEYSLRDEADLHSRNMRCIVDQVCKQAGEIKELKVLVTGVVDGKKAPSCKQVEKKIKKLEKRKDKEAKKHREEEMEERERRKRESKDKDGNVQEATSNLCCKCGEKKAKRSMGCCGKCCAKRCFGCCGRCCGGCCPKCCDKCCFPCEKCCPCCCALASCCDTCWSCGCCPRRKKKCKCSK